MMNPTLYLRDVWSAEETTEGNARTSGGKREPRLPRRRGRFTYTVERLQSGCLLYQLAPAWQSGEMEE